MKPLRQYFLVNFSKIQQKTLKKLNFYIRLHYVRDPLLEIQLLNLGPN